ncbi:protogenin [Ixodes scapularis]|uniref:protogenin n=1 Tax=Ixodes scapularis TaxID=6945 RepID=UPI001C381566|nr:protogenin [Ixodes scapularis]
MHMGGSQCIPRGVNFTRLSEPRLVVVKNEPLLLQCSVSSLPELAPVNVTWNHDGVPQQLGSVLPNGSLLIERVAHHKKKNGRKDDGDYSCLAHTKAGIMFSPPVQVKVARMAKGFTEEPRPVNAPVGGIARFACHIGAVPPAHYTWQRNLEDLPFGDPRFTQLSSGILQIINTTASDAGNYRCIAKNIAKTMQSAEAALTVPPTVHHEQPPEFLSPPSQELTSVVGETVEFECLLRSSLHPVITWLREGVLPLPEGRSFIVGQGNLRIEKLKRSDAGRYQCLVNFMRGTPQALTSLSQSHTLDVHEPPSFTADLASLVSPAARTVRFECDTQGFPAPEVRWFKDGKPLIINGRIKVLHSEDNKYLPEDRRHVTEEADHHRRKPPNHMLVISHLVRRDAGFYQCVASNPAGTSTLAARLQVNASGDAPSPPSDLTARTLSSTSILLSWSPPLSPGNRVVQAYSVHYLPTSGGIELQKVSVNTSCIVDKLTAFTNYTFYVRAYSGKSASEQSEEITQITGEDVPLAAPSVSVTSLTPTTMHISWSELSPSVARGFIALYRIHYRLHDQNYNHVMEVKGNVQEYTITGLEPTKQYSVRVMAGTVQGFPHLSDEEWPWVTYRMPDGFSSSVPLPPSLYLSVVNSTTLEARWSLLPEEKSAISGFKLRLREQGSLMTEPIVLPNSSFSYVLYDLKPQTWYEVHVLCFSNFGDGQEAVQTVLTHPENLTAEGDIDPPGGLEAEPTSSRSIHLSWRAPVPAQNISYYTVRYSAVRPKSVHNSSMVQYIPSTKTEVVVADLQPSTLYGFAVKSHGADSHMSHFSQLIECKTSEDKPTAPRDITWAPLDLGSIRVHWQAPEFPNGVIQNYHIFYNACEPDVTQMDKWLTRSEPGTRLTSVLNGLAINTVYSLRLQAQTSAGRGPLTQVIKFVISVPSPSTSSPHPQAAGQQDEDPSLGILLGVAAGLLCMTLCAIIILYKNKKCSNTNEDSTSEGRLASQSCFATLFSRRKTPATPRELELLSSPPNASEDHLDTKGGYPQCNGKTNGHAKDKRLRDVTLNGHVGNGSAVHTTNSSPPCYNNRDPESRLPLPRSQHRYDASDCFLQTEGGPWTEGRTSAPTPLLGDHSSAAWRDIEEPTTAAEEEQATLETIVSADNSFVSHRDVASDTTNTSVHPEA